MLTFVVNSGINIDYNKPSQKIELEHINVDILLQIIQRIKFSKVLIVKKNDGFLNSRTIYRMLHLIKRNHALVLLDENNNAIFDYILFDTSFLKLVLRNLDAVGYKLFDGLIRGMGKIHYVPKSQMMSIQKGIIVKPGKIPDKLNIFMTHYFWMGAYYKYLWEKRKDYSIIIKSARAFEAEAQLYEKKKIMNLAISAYKDSIEMYKLANNERYTYLQDKLNELM